MSFETASNYLLYQKYKQIKDSLYYNYRGIDLSKVIAWNLLGLVVFDDKAKLRDFIFLPFMRVDTSKFVKAFSANESVFSTIYNTRKDHAELLAKISSSVSNSDCLTINPHYKSIRVNFIDIIMMAKYIFKNRELKEYSYINRLHLWFYLIYFCNQLRDFEKAFSNIDIKDKKYIPFLSAVGVEALLTLFFNTKGVQTFHIFHGIFGRYKNKIANDIINGENITASNILAFSESTKKDLNRDFGHDLSKVFVAGNPKYPFKEIVVNTRFRKCIVLNGFSFYDKEFVHLLKLLNTVSEETGISFDIKPHPSSKILSYPEIAELKNINFIPKGKTVKELFNQECYDFAITFNTVTYYECMYYNLICLRYGINENLNFEGLNDKFTDKETLLKIIENFKADNVIQLNHNIEQLLINVLGMGKNKYDQIINKIKHQ